MTEQHPAGWYAQPDGSQRYWNGIEWAEHRPAAGIVQSEPSRPRHWYQKKRVIIPAAGLALLMGIGALQGGQGGATQAAAPLAASSSVTTPAAPAASTPPVATSSTPEASPTPEQTTATPTDEPSAESEDLSEDEAEPDDPGYTVSQEQAIDKAAEYLAYTAFSKSGLIGQLKFEGFSKADASFAVEHVSVDWNEQAAIKAQDYLDYTSFSRSGLIKQLEFEGFTHKQALHGVKVVGL